MAEQGLRAGWESSLLIWHFLSLQSNHMGLALSSLNPLQTLTHNDPLLNVSLLTPSCPAALSNQGWAHCLQMGAARQFFMSNFAKTTVCTAAPARLSVVTRAQGTASHSFPVLTHTQTTTAHPEAPGSSKVISSSKRKAWVLNNTAADV